MRNTGTREGVEVGGLDSFLGDSAIQRTVRIRVRNENFQNPSSLKLSNYMVATPRNWQEIPSGFRIGACVQN